MRKPVAKATPPAPIGILIRRDGTNLGPYTEVQVAQMVRDGIIAPIDLAWRDGLTQWQPLCALGIKGCFPPPPAPSQHMQNGSAANPFLQTLALQSKMKSKAVAALLSIFLPYIGCFYASIFCGIVSTAFGVLFMWAYLNPVVKAEFDPFWLVLSSVAYVISIFCAIGAVGRSNSKLIASVQ